MHIENVKQQKDDGGVKLKYNMLGGRVSWTFKIEIGNGTGNVGNNAYVFQE